MHNRDVALPAEDSVLIIQLLICIIMPFFGKLGKGIFVYVDCAEFHSMEVNDLPSEKILEQKKAIVTELADKLKSSCAGVVVDYKGIKVADDTKLRKELRESGVDYFVVKNTLLSRAAEQAGIEGLDPVLEGTTAIALSNDDYIAPAKILCNFASENNTFKVKSGFVDGKIMSVTEINELAKLPSKEVLIAKALGGLNAPISGFVTVLNGTIKGLVVALNAIAEKQGA